MRTIESFLVDHTRLNAGIYVSRRDGKGDGAVTTFDLRVTAPNREPPMEIAAAHTIEHLGATFLRNSARKDDVLYFGPMGCRTGFYLLMFGRENPRDIAPLIREMCTYIVNFEGEIPGATAKECGNYRDHNLPLAKRYAAHYLEALNAENFIYP